MTASCAYILSKGARRALYTTAGPRYDPGVEPGMDPPRTRARLLASKAAPTWAPPATACERVRRPSYR
eukprot:5875476-Prymnesium_polylepis.1